MNTRLNNWLADDLMQHNSEVLIIVVDKNKQMKAYEKFQSGGVMNTFLIGFLTELIKTANPQPTNGDKSTTYTTPPDWGWNVECLKDLYTRRLIMSGHTPVAIDIFANIAKHAIHIHPSCFHQPHNGNGDKNNTDGFEISFR